MSDNKNQKIGGVWMKKKANGEPFLSIQIEENGVKKNYTAWKNTYKEPGDKKPDFSVVVNDYVPGQAKQSTDEIPWR